MTVYPSSRIQAERTIAAGRVALAASSLFAIWLDPAEPARFTQVNYGLHFAFVSYRRAARGDDLALARRDAAPDRDPCRRHRCLLRVSVLHVCSVQPVLHVLHVLDVLRRDPLGPERHAGDRQRRDRHLRSS